MSRSGDSWSRIDDKIIDATNAGRGPQWIADSLGLEVDVVIRRLRVYSVDVPAGKRDPLARVFGSAG